ncbi:protein kinase 2B, chloroplastic-like [Gossypium australe]|uniref:Protein kinase 2B, chloroplastic-like n=1 Tax=Gossypium australe TaxID=47621 RepID=A0A5B6W007_9ROSI|nr:protein kinase 2B, chloroplastic-like [Gossypium australe]
MDEDSEVPLILSRPFLVTTRTIIDVGTCELLLHVGDEKIILQACNSVRVSSERDDIKCSVNVSNHVAQPSLQETPRENMLEPCFSQGDRNRTTYEERMVQLDELDKWRVHVEEKLKKYDRDTKQRHDEHVRDKVLLDKSDTLISPSELKSNRSNSFTVLNVFTYGTVEVTHFEFDTFKVNNTRLKPDLGSKIDNKKEEFRL